MGEKAAQAPQFQTAFEPRHGAPVEVAPDIARITAANPGPFTFHGTNTYILGRKRLAVIDPGPMDEAHLQAILSAVGGREVSHILITHTHADHSPLAAALKAATGAKVLAEGGHREARQLHLGEINPLDASADRAFQPDAELTQGEIVEGGEWTLETLHTPGHTANHAAFALLGQSIVFSGDHVMAWATSIVAPPDGSMRDYMASLDRMIERPENVYLPGHGGRLEKAREFTRALRAHRRMREAAILARVRAGDQTIRNMVRVIYAQTDPRLHGAAALSVLAHLEDLVQSGRVVTDGPPSLEGEYRPA